MKVVFIVIVMFVAGFSAIMISKHVAGKIHEEEGLAGDAAMTLEDRSADIEKLHKDLETRKEDADKEKRKGEQYDQLDSSRLESRMDVPEFREESDASTFKALTALPKSMSKWQTWLMLGCIGLVGWMVWIRVRPHK